MRGDNTVKNIWLGMWWVLLAAGYCRAGQTPLNSLPAQTADTNRVNTLNALAAEHRNGEPGKAIDYAREAHALATKLGFRSGKARALDHIGWGYYRLGELDKALSFSLQGLRESQAANARRETVNASINVASIYYEQNNYTLAISYFYRAWKMSQQLGDGQLTGRALNNLGFLYFKQGNYPKSLEYSFQALRNNRQLKDGYLVSFSLRTIGDVYAMQGRYARALSYQSEAFEAARVVGNKYMMVTSLNRMGDLYTREANYARAIECQQQALALSQAAGFRPDLVSIYASLADVYAKRGNYVEAYQYQQAGIALKDSIYNERTSRQIAQLQTRFETERKEQENRLLRAENEKKQAMLGKHYWTGVAGLSLSLLLAGTSAFLYLAYRQKKRVNRVLEGQKSEIVRQNGQLTRLNQEVSGQNQELAQLNRVKNQFLSIISHDVRAPLTSLQGVLSLARLEALSLPEFQALLDKLSGQVQHNLLLLDNLLHWTSCQMNGLQVNRTVVDLRAVAAANVALYAPVAEQKCITVQCSLPDPLVVTGDEEMLKTVVRNLLNNAIKFTPTGGRVSLNAQVHTDRVQFTVQDTGVGIPAERLPRLFEEAACSTPGTEQEKGKGLGLKVCHEFILHNQGQLWVESGPGKGSSFHFTVPAAKAGQMSDGRH